MLRKVKNIFVLGKLAEVGLRKNCSDYNSLKWEIPNLSSMGKQPK